MAPGDITIGRRIPLDENGELPLGSFNPGDYCGPVAQPNDSSTSVYFLLPGARDEGVQGPMRAIHRVAQPPHTFRECEDGSLEIRASIGCHNPDGSFYWHGYLDEGHQWREV
jgi:hypothetical protein